MAATASLDTDFSTENSLSFLPFATYKVLADFNNFRASDSDSFLLAETVSFISMLLASKNLDALTQLVQPPRW